MEESGGSWPLCGAGRGARRRRTALNGGLTELAFTSTRKGKLPGCLQEGERRRGLPISAGTTGSR